MIMKTIQGQQEGTKESQSTSRDCTADNKVQIRNG